MEPTHTPAAAPVRMTGVLLALSVLASIALMAHHPAGGGRGASGLVEHIARHAPVSQAVHGLLIAILLLQWMLLSQFAFARGLGAAWIRAAVLLWGFGTVHATIAALISGFVVPDLAAWAVAPEPRLSAEVASEQMLMLYAMNQALSNLGTLALSAAMGCWSMDLVRQGRYGIVLGGFGLLAAAGLVLGVATGALQLDVHGMLLAWTLLSLWLLGLAGAMIARR